MRDEAGPSERGRKGVGSRREETNQMFKRDWSPSRLCMFSGRGRRGYSRAGDCSNNTPPQHTASPPSFPLWGDLFFPLPCYIGLALLRTDKSGDGHVIKASLFFQLLRCTRARFGSWDQIWLPSPIYVAIKQFKAQASLRASGKGIIHTVCQVVEDRAALCRSY